VARRNPAANAATSVDAAVVVYQLATFPWSHCRASVVFPYPAGATSILILPWLSSSSVVNRGRSMIRRRRIGCLVAVPSPMSRQQAPQARFDTISLFSPFE
jgi:hypothetical protein